MCHNHEHPYNPKALGHVKEYLIPKITILEHNGTLTRNET